MQQRIQVIELGIIESKIVEKPVEDQLWGFLIQPNFIKDGVNLRIRFELLLPIDSKRHIYCNTISGFFIEFFNADYLKSNTDMILNLIQVSMAHTRLTIMQMFSEYSYIPMQYLDSKHFESELKQQIAELKL
ncbi:hypothetical protein [Flavobacterium aestivum]|uniref:hypothetical protein n=1 Tax=Flavobacterium aestivum TaxID=3003257 RepID=UPI002286AFEC|nr:hypothetical protein [Flavobacterium aestivum]